MSFRDRLHKLRLAIAEGPASLSVAAWVEKAAVSAAVVKPGYRSEISESTRRALAAGAAEVLSWDRGQMDAWLVQGQQVPDLEKFLERLPTLARCVGCDKWLPRAQVIKGVSRCHPCAADHVRQVQRLRRNPQADHLFIVAEKVLPEIRAKNPEFAKAIEECLEDQSRALKIARIQRAINVARAACGAMAISRLRVEAMMGEFGLRNGHPEVENPRELGGIKGRKVRKIDRIT